MPGAMENLGGLSTAGDWVDGTLTYLANRSIRPVWHRSAQEDESHWHEGVFSNFNVRIHNMRRIAGDLSLDRNGFILVHHRTAVRDLDNLDDVHAIYFPEMEAIVREVTGAHRIISMPVTIRDVDNALPYLRPFHRVHSDFTDENAPEWARSLLLHEGLIGPVTSPPVSPDEADAILQRRYAEYNVWRPIDGPVIREPVALLDASTVDPDDVMICTSEAGNTLYGVYNPAHRWYYAPKMQTDEVLIFKCYDSARDGRCRFTLHSAFEHPQTPTGAPKRRSLEMRVFAYFHE